jgi:aryl-alcohol dehydrogenase-like predicted oxidoreductase
MHERKWWEMRTEMLVEELGIRIGLGTFPFAGVFGDVTQDQANEVFRAFIDLGGRYVETAPSYPYSAVDMGDLLAVAPRSAFFLATKCVTGKNRRGETVEIGERHHLRRQVEQELTRLRTGHVDLLQAHHPPEDVSMHDLASALLELRDEGLTRFVGISNVDLAQVEEFVSAGPLDFVQNRWSLLHRAAHRPLLRFCGENGIYFNPFQVIERGQLTEAPSIQAERRNSDLRTTKQEYVGERYTVVRDWVESELRPIAQDADCDLESLAIGWLLAQPQVAVAVVGAKSPQQIQGLARRATPLSPEVVAEVDRRFAAFEQSIEDEHGQSVEAFRGLT